MPGQRGNAGASLYSIGSAAMAEPEHFSRDVPRRCLHLINRLWHQLDTIHDPRDPDGGTLTATFVLAMSTPIVLLPIELIDRTGRRGNPTSIDDRGLDQSLTDAINRGLGGGQLQNAPFFEKNSWASAKRSSDKSPSLRHGLDFKLIQELGTEQAEKAANEMPCNQWSSIIRNALAHGGVVYLDKEGRHARENEVAMLAFVSRRIDRDTNSPTDSLVLRVSLQNYLIFLDKWVGWLDKSGIAGLLNAAA
ncbi:hypothetical protein SAMN05216241_101542 [Limimonas halophila]|uniref:pEK499-p136 HEPN domain-containing protein n=2 Tax=Limimonas halophila TaxID=1082479 RepID=A0A1G7MAQ5_9PROT|nr:hypothetical protein SAMN05216241_101542 [Limimonas halophila]